MELRTYIVITVVSLLSSGWSAPRAAAQAGAAAPAATARTPGVRLNVTEGSQVRYRVREQLAGINFPSDAVGTTSALKGALVIRPDGTFDAAQSKLTVDLRTLKSDQERRDEYVLSNVLETQKFPTAEFVARRAEGMPWPFPTENRGPKALAGFKLSGDLTIHGVTRPVTWQAVTTFIHERVSGIATTSIRFSDFGVTKPAIAILLSVEDTIQLEIDFKLLKATT